MPVFILYTYSVHELKAKLEVLKDQILRGLDCL